MAISERKIIDSIEVLSTNHIQVRESTVLERDGQELSRQYHRYCLEPNSDVSELPERIQAIANAAWNYADVTLSITDYSASV